MKLITILVAGCVPLMTAVVASAGEVAGSVEHRADVVDVVLQHGVVGAMLLIVLYGFWQKDKQLATESAARIADAKATSEVMRTLVVATTTQMERFNDTAEALVQELRTERHASSPSMQRPPTGPGVRR
jgi:hypothetical protein